MNCNTCTHWDGDPVTDTYGTCDAIVATGTPTPETQAYVSGHQSQQAKLTTRKTFGCPLWKPAPW